MDNFFTVSGPTRRQSARAKRPRNWRWGWLALGLTLPGLPALAQFPRVESFKNGTATNFTVGGTATLTSGAADPNGEGYLRLTTAILNQAGYAIDQTGFVAPQGFSISFEFFAYGGTGADGFSTFLVDDAITSFSPGASGGSLGYAQKTIFPISDGVPSGYIGIGIDEFGNFANPTEGRVGGPGFTPNAVSVRGAGSGRSTTDYPYLDGSGGLPFSLDVTTVRAQVGDDDYRRAYIDLVPTNGTYQVTVRIQHGNDVTTAIRALTVPPPPPRLRIGFAGSTGAQTNVHEIRNLAIVRAPFANDDLAGTPFNQPVTLDVLANDIAPGSNFDPNSLDLNINQAGRQTSRVIPGKGTFSLDAQGRVVFTPLGTYAGPVTAPYTVKTVLGDESSPANITILVQGADLASTVSGPSTANPGSRITYTLNVANLGTQDATNVVPTLTLAPALPAGSLTLPAGASYAAGTGVVTFAAIPTLAAGASPVSNSLTFNLPATGLAALLGTGNVTADTPDPSATNNVSSITTSVSGLANVATVCAEPGRDGPGALTSLLSPNTYYAPASGTVLAAGSTSIPLGAAALGGLAPIQAGDLVLVMQMQGADISTDNNPTANTYGTVTGSYTAGLYEYAIATSDVPLAGGVLTLAKGLTNAYANQDYDGTLTGQRRFQVIRVPQYSSLSVTGTVSGAAWNGQTGGVLALDVAGKTTFSPGAALSMDAKGFRGGGGVLGLGSAATNNATFRAPTSAAAHGAKGEGLAGTPHYVYDGTAVVATATEGYLNGSTGRGAPGNGGGGATDYAPTTVGGNSGNAGGGGGGNGGAGGLGGFGYGSGATGAQAAAGQSVTGGSASRLFLGGGGGAGSSNDPTAALSSGGVGGGIIVLRTGSLTGAGTLTADGGNAADAGVNDQGGGGGGAGGTILVLASPPTGIADGLSALSLSATGGNGANANTNSTSDATRFGPGGGGGGGLVYVNGTFANAAASPSPVQAGLGGYTDGAAGVATSFGATAGNAGVLTTNVDPTTTPVIAGAGPCQPVLTALLTTTTPTVTRTGGAGTAVHPAQYVLTISNTGGTARNVSTTAALASSIIGYDNTVTPTLALTLANGTVSALTSTLPAANGTSTPAFGNMVVPAGAAVSIAFQASVATAAQNNFPYQASALLAYLDPTRTSTSTTIQPGQTYQSYTGAAQGVAAAPGSGYLASSSTGEDVTVVLGPLPVELTSFEAKAVQHDALLTWTTASETHNDRFEVERSLDGTTFERVGTVRGGGNVLTPSSYRFTDVGAGRLPGSLVYYRLRQVDTDGTATFSPVRTIQFARATRADVSLYPNPHSGRTTLDLTGLPAGEYQVQVLDLTGRVVSTHTLTGLAQHELPVRDLASGSYLVRIQGKGPAISLLMTRE